MTSTDAIQTIESDDFAIRAGMASDFRVFAKCVWAEDATQSLRVSLASGERREALMQRVQELAEREVDSRFENPWDVALAVYLLLLYAESEVVGRMAAIAVRRAQGSWWVARLIPWILHPGGRLAAPLSSSSAVDPGTGRPWTARQLDVGDSLLQVSPIQDVHVSSLLGSTESAISVGAHDEPPTPILPTSRQSGTEAKADESDDFEVTVT